MGTHLRHVWRAGGASAATHREHLSKKCRHGRSSRRPCKTEIHFENASYWVSVAAAVAVATIGLQVFLFAVLNFLFNMVCTIINLERDGVPWKITREGSGGAAVPCFWFRTDGRHVDFLDIPFEFMIVSSGRVWVLGMDSRV